MSKRRNQEQAKNQCLKEKWREIAEVCLSHSYYFEIEDVKKLIYDTYIYFREFKDNDYMAREDLEIYKYICRFSCMLYYPDTWMASEVYTCMDFVIGLCYLLEHGFGIGYREDVLPLTANPFSAGSAEPTADMSTYEAYEMAFKENLKYYMEEYDEDPYDMYILIGEWNGWSDYCGINHFLIGGASGSGKTVWMQAAITDVLRKMKKDTVRLVIIDPKGVGYQVYDGIPHLQYPVISDIDEAIRILEEIVTEKGRRIDIFSSFEVDNIYDYNQLVIESDEEKFKDIASMPHVLIFIDELAELMRVKPDKFENLVCKLTAKDANAGIYLIMSTQCLSEDIITEQMRDGIPGRIAFRLASEKDSKLILGVTGAEKLEKPGELLFYMLDSPSCSELKNLHTIRALPGKIKIVCDRFKK